MTNVAPQNPDENKEPKLTAEQEAIIEKTLFDGLKNLENEENITKIRDILMHDSSLGFGSSYTKINEGVVKPYLDSITDPSEKAHAEKMIEHAIKGFVLKTIRARSEKLERYNELLAMGAGARIGKFKNWAEDKKDEHAVDEKINDTKPEIDLSDEMIIEKMKTPGNVKKLIDLYENIVNIYGEKPSDEDIKGKELYYKTGPIGLGEFIPLTENDVKNYTKIKKYIEGAELKKDAEGKLVAIGENEIGVNRYLNAIVSNIEADDIDLSKANPETLEETIKTLARQRVDGLRKANPAGPKEAMLFYVLNVTSWILVKKKVENAMKLRLIPRSRYEGGKVGHFYEFRYDKEDKLIGENLEDFAKKPNGEMILVSSFGILSKMYKRHRNEANGSMSLNKFHHEFVEIIKTKGGNGSANYDQAMTRSMYCEFLLLLDTNVNESDVVSVLYGIKPDEKPWVYDLEFTHDGVEIYKGDGDGKNTDDAMDDFVSDGAMFIELQEALGINRFAFIVFIKKIAPKFELLRNSLHKLNITNIEDLIKMKDEKVIKDFGLSDKDLELFWDLTKMPHWDNKVGKAYKHAMFLDKEGEIIIPHAIAMQGRKDGQSTTGGHGGVDPTGENSTGEKLQLDVVFIDVTEKIKRVARRKAAERLDKELKEMGPKGWKEIYKINKILGKYWKRNAMQGYLDQYEKEEEKKLRENIGDKDFESQLDAIAERMGIAWFENESADLIGDESGIHALENGDEIQIQKAVQNICNEYLNNKDEDKFRKAVKDELLPLVNESGSKDMIAFIEEKFGEKDGVEKRGLLDQLKKAQKATTAVEMDNIRIILGKAQNVDVKTDIRDLEKIDKYTRWVVERMQKSKWLGRIVPPTTIAILGFGLSNMATQIGSSTAGRVAIGALMGLTIPISSSTAAGVAVGALMGAGFAYFRQNKEQLHLKAQKERRRAIRYKTENDNRGLGSRYEARLEKSSGLYKQKSAKKLSGNIEKWIKENKADDALNDESNKPVPLELNYMIHHPSHATTLNDESNKFGPLGLDYLIKHTANAMALNEVSENGIGKKDKRKIDLIKFSNENSIEKERLELERSIAAGKKYINDIDEKYRDSGAKKLLAAALKQRRKEIKEMVAKADKNFRKFKFRENVKAAGMGFVMGATFSLGAQMMLGEIFGGGVETNQIDFSKIKNTEDLGKMLKDNGFGEHVEDIKAHLNFDKTGQIEHGDFMYLKEHYGKLHLYGRQEMATTDLHVGNLTSGLGNADEIARYSGEDLLNALSSKNINLPKDMSPFDRGTGHITSDFRSFLAEKHINITEVADENTGIVFTSDFAKNLANVTPGDVAGKVREHIGEVLSNTTTEGAKEFSGSIDTEVIKDAKVYPIFYGAPQNHLEYGNEQGDDKKGGHPKVEKDGEGKNYVKYIPDGVKAEKHGSDEHAKDGHSQYLPPLDGHDDKTKAGSDKKTAEDLESKKIIEELEKKLAENKKNLEDNKEAQKKFEEEAEKRIKEALEANQKLEIKARGFITDQLKEKEISDLIAKNQAEKEALSAELEKSRKKIKKAKKKNRDKNAGVPPVNINILNTSGRGL